MIRRRFIDVAEGQIHTRMAGEDNGGVPLVMIYASPYSAKMIEPLIAAVGTSRWAIGLDPLGQGDSSPPAVDSPDIAYFADSVVRAMDALGVDQFDLYGVHTGVHIGAEAAVLHSQRVRKLVFEAPGLETNWAFREEYAAHVEEEVPLDHWGTQFLTAFNITKDLYLFWPYYRYEADNVRTKGLPSAQELHDRTVELAKSLATYRHAYVAALRNDLPARYPQITCPVMVTAPPGDPNAAALPKVAELLQSGTVVPYPESGAPEEFAATMAAWLAT